MGKAQRERQRRYAQGEPQPQRPLLPADVADDLRRIRLEVGRQLMHAMIYGREVTDAQQEGDTGRGHSQPLSRPEGRDREER